MNASPQTLLHASPLLLPALAGRRRRGLLLGRAPAGDGRGPCGEMAREAERAGLFRRGRRGQLRRTCVKSLGEGEKYQWSPPSLLPPSPLLTLSAPARSPSLPPPPQKTPTRPCAVISSARA